MVCSPQYVNKLLRGTENLQLETITKIEQILDINLIQVVDFETIVQEQPENSQTYTIFNKIISGGEWYVNYKELFEEYSYGIEHDIPFKSVA